MTWEAGQSPCEIEIGIWKSKHVNVTWGHYVQSIKQPGLSLSGCIFYLFAFEMKGITGEKI